AAGDVLRYAIPAVALFFIAVGGDSDLAWDWIAVIAVTQVLTELLKKLFNFTPLGKRPDGNDDSMPSGHSSMAFSGAWVFYFVYGPVAAIVPLLLATLTATSRVLAKRHHWYDVTAGGALALVVAERFLN
ncbi:MAG: phosphatase PAP2 family protein, partial [Candidatus Kariarchaeaceae archaeon]